MSVRWKRASVFLFCAAVLPLPLGVLLEGIGALPDGGTVRLGLPVACAGVLGHVAVFIVLLRLTGTGAAERRALLRRLFWTPEVPGELQELQSGAVAIGRNG